MDSVVFFGNFEQVFTEWLFLNSFVSCPNIYEEPN